MKKVNYKSIFIQNKPTLATKSDLVTNDKGHINEVYHLLNMSFEIFVIKTISEKSSYLENLTKVVPLVVTTFAI